MEELKYFQPVAGSDPVYTGVGASGLTQSTPALTPLMLNDEGALIAWDGLKAGTALGLSALSADGTAATVTYFKSGTWRIDDVKWPDGASQILKRNAFIGTALSVA
ncbi:MAG: head decoration protein [Plesiomonas sp.]